MTDSPFLMASGIVKQFGGTIAVNDVSLSLERGSIHGLVGENGAGKSTLCKVIAGVHAPDAGTLQVDGRPQRFRSPADALHAGVGLIAQEVALVPSRSVADNVFLGDERARAGLVSRRAMARQCALLADELEFDLSPHKKVGDLAFSDQQKVEIMRAVARRSSVLIMDEPTASLGPTETHGLMRVMRQLRDEGTSIVFISHHLDEVLSVCDLVTIMRDGRHVRTSPVGIETERTLVKGMLGRDADEMFPAKEILSPESRRTVLSVRGLGGSKNFNDVSFDVAAGEIVGVAGLVGAGRSEVARAVFGADKARAGEVWVDGKMRRTRSPRRSVREGLGMIPESRRDLGLIMQWPMAENIALPNLEKHARFGFVSVRKLRQTGTSMAERLDIRSLDPRTPVGRMSGGNQQKTLFAKWTRFTPKVLIIDEPTRGVDIGAKQGIYQLIASMAQEGVGVLLISSELEEVIGLSHRVLVMSRGRMVDELSGDRLTESNVMSAAFEVEPENPEAAS
jgi:ABC-type sugar transport system ATPase subunit